MCIHQANDSTLWRRHLLTAAAAAATATATDTTTRLGGNHRNDFHLTFGGLELPQRARRNATNEPARRPPSPERDANFTTAASSLSQAPASTSAPSSSAAAAAHRLGRRRSSSSSSSSLSLSHFDVDYLDVRLYQQLRDWICRQISKIRAYQMIPRSIRFDSAQAQTDFTSERPLGSWRPRQRRLRNASERSIVGSSSSSERQSESQECLNKGLCKWTYLFDIFLLIAHLLIALKIMFDFDLPHVLASQAKVFLGSPTNTVLADTMLPLSSDNQASLLQINLMISNQQHDVQLKSATSYSNDDGDHDGDDYGDGYTGQITGHEPKQLNQVEVAHVEGREYLHGQGSAWSGTAGRLLNATNIFHYLLIVALVDFFSNLKWPCRPSPSALLQSRQYEYHHVRSTNGHLVGVEQDHSHDNDGQRHILLTPVQREFTQITLDSTHDDGNDDDDDYDDYDNDYDGDNKVSARGHTSWPTAIIMRLLLNSRHLFQFVQVGLFAPLLSSNVDVGSSGGGGGQSPVSSLILLMSFLNHLNQSARFALYLCKLHRHGHTQHHNHHQRRRSLFDVAHRDIIGHDRRVANYKFNYLPLISRRLNYESVLSKFEKYLILSRILHLQLTMLTLSIQLDSLPSGCCFGCCCCSMSMIALVFCTLESLRALYLQCDKYYSIKLANSMVVGNSRANNR